MGPIASRRLEARQWRRVAAWLAAFMLLIVVAYYGIRPFVAGAGSHVRLIVYAFSTQEEVFTQGIFPSFEREWEAGSGRDLVIEGVFGASGTLAGHINLGAPADVAVLSNAKDADWLRVGRRLSLGSEPVIVGCTPLIIAMRSDSPFVVREYADLGQTGLDLLHANPRSSGVGQWAMMAEYGSGFLPARDQPAAESQLEAIWGNVRLLADSARAAMTLFELGAGDALVTYEQDALRAADRGVSLEIVYPPRTIVAHPVALIVDDNVTRSERTAVDAFIDYLVSDAGQQIFGQYYLRPRDCHGGAFADLVDPFSVQELGGWSQAYSDLVEPIWLGRIEPTLNLEPVPGLLGVGEE